MNRDVVQYRRRGESCVAKKDDHPYRVGRDWLYNLRKSTPGRLYVLFGQEDFRRKAALDILKERLVDPALAAFNYRRFEGTGLTEETLADAVNRPPMMAERTLIVVRDLDVYKNKWVENIVDALPEYVCLVFEYDLLECKTDGRLKIHKLLTKNGELADFVQAPPGELTAWMKSRCAERKVRIPQDAMNALTFRCGVGMTNLAHEIDKLCAYVTNGRITQEDVEAATCAVPEAQVFKLCDALAERNSGYAQRLLGELEQARQEAIPTLALIGRQMRQLYGVRLLIDSGGGVSAVMELCGLKYGNLAEKLLRSARKLSLTGLREAVRLCAETDAALKSTGLDGFTLLRDLVTELHRALA